MQSTDDQQRWFIAAAQLPIVLLLLLKMVMMTAAHFVTKSPYKREKIPIIPSQSLRRRAPASRPIRQDVHGSLLTLNLWQRST